MARGVPGALQTLSVEFPRRWNVALGPGGPGGPGGPVGESFWIWGETCGFHHDVWGFQTLTFENFENMGI